MRKTIITCDACEREITGRTPTLKMPIKGTEIDNVFEICAECCKSILTGAAKELLKHPEEAAQAIDNYLVTGDSKWAEIIPQDDDDEE